MLKHVSVDEGCAALCNLPVNPSYETVALGDALSRVAAFDVRAPISVPPFDRSPYDGFAFRGADTAKATRENPVTLRITEEIPAGVQPRKPITPGHAAKILTGAPIPAGADVTVKFEHTRFDGDTVTVFEAYKPGTDIVRAGSDIAAGDIVARRGDIISAPVISAFANVGLASIEVFRRPAVTVLSTGTELLEPGEPLRPAMIYNSNVYTLSAYLAAAGAQPVNGGTVEDSPALIAQKIKAALEVSDMVVTTGGASVGDYDFAVSAAEALDAQVLFWKAALKPGGAIMAATLDGKVILGLSGNPGAAVIGLLRIAMPYVKKLCGRTDCFYPEIQVRLKEPYLKPSEKLRILRGRLEIDDSGAYFAQSDAQGAEAVLSFSGCDLLGEIPQGSPPLPEGTAIKAYRLI